MNKRKRHQQQENAIKIVSRIENLDKAPDQVLKFIILEQQQIIISRDKVIQDQDQKLQEYRDDLDRSDLEYCKFGQHYTQVRTGYSCDDCGKDEMCRNCSEDHDCQGYSKDSEQDENEQEEQQSQEEQKEHQEQEKQEEN